MEIIDISPLIRAETAVFPGDQPFELNTSMDYGLGHHLKLSSMNTTLHIGAHADAPNHYHPKGEGIHERDLSLYCGPCRVLTAVLGKEGRIYPEQFTDEQLGCPRLLFRTDSYQADRWCDDFASLSPELIERASKLGAKLFGIDTPSVDPSTSKDLPSHQALFRTNSAVLEGIVLTHVEAGDYTLIALPLRIKDADASPVRAVLLKSEAGPLF